MFVWTIQKFIYMKIWYLLEASQIHETVHWLLLITEKCMGFVKSVGVVWPKMQRFDWYYLNIPTNIQFIQAYFTLLYTSLFLYLMNLSIVMFIISYLKGGNTMDIRSPYDENFSRSSYRNVVKSSFSLSSLSPKIWNDNSMFVHKTSQTKKGNNHPEPVCT